ncbi:hypothetical protein JVU11DRAFT_3493 [Chiua virens]|nr:hypothetical protein JVU11DRAFT_3493 [Chiua virens]
MSNVLTTKQIIMASETISSENVRNVVPSIDTEQRQASASFTTNPASTSPQQRASIPSDVRAIPADQIKKPSEVNRDDPNINVVELPPHSPTFKEQIYGYGRLVRGTVLGNPDAKEEGSEILRGERSVPQRRASTK